VSDFAHLARYLKKQHVLSLCCATADDLWCANCFYVFNEPTMALWLMTETHTRHGAMLLQQPRVAGTINGQPKSVLLIKGIQYTGDIALLSGEAEIAAREAYCQRFPVARKASAPLWEIRLRELKMTDNKLGFGSKIAWQREESERAIE